MLDRQNRLLIGLVDEHAGHAKQGSNLLTNVDSWMGNAASKLEQDEENDNAFTTPQVRANAVVGQLLNEQTARGEQLADVHTKMSQMMAILQESSKTVREGTHGPGLRRASSPWHHQPLYIPSRPPPLPPHLTRSLTTAPDPRRGSRRSATPRCWRRR